MLYPVTFWDNQTLSNSFLGEWVINMNLTERLKLVVFLLFLTAIIIFFGQRKQDFHMDEIANYGLSNHVVGKDAHIDYGKVYTGLGPFEDFVEVDATQRFNYRNVYHNQWEDVHPPLY